SSRAASRAFPSFPTRRSSDLGGLLEHMPGERELALRDHFLFTIVAAAATSREAAVWVLGDGAYAIDGRTHVIGPFADNQPPYLRSEEHTSELQSRFDLVCRLL